MIAWLRGTVLERGAETVILETEGVGYEVFLAPSTLARAAPGAPLELFVSESTAMYGGGTTLYGFPTREEKEIFLSLREHVPATGAKKALEYLEKASKSLPDFRRAVLEEDARMLADVFGFTRKSAERIIAGLKGRLGEAGRAAPARAGAAAPGPARALQQAMDALASLGYKPAQSRQALESLAGELRGREATLEDILRLALKRIS